MAKTKKERISLKKQLAFAEAQRDISRSPVTKESREIGKRLLKEQRKKERENANIRELERKVKYQRVGALTGLFKNRKGNVTGRAEATQKLFDITGQNKLRVVGRGRPSASYKYGMPIQDYKKLQNQQRAQFEIYKQNQQGALRREGLTPEQVNQLQYIRSLQGKGIPVEIRAPQGPIDTAESVMAPVDDELEFRKFRADKTISPNTQNILRRLRYIQLKSQRDDVEMQRRLKERRIVNKAGNILDTPFIFNRYQFNVTGVDESNILKAPNIFRERVDNKIMTTGRPNVLQTGETGNNLRFFG